MRLGPTVDGRSLEMLCVLERTCRGVLATATEEELDMAESRVWNVSIGISVVTADPGRSPLLGLGDRMNRSAADSQSAGIKTL